MRSNGRWRCSAPPVRHLHECAVLNNLGLTQQMLGRRDDAEATLRQALELSERSGYRLGVANALRGLGRLATEQRRFGEAGRLLADALRTAETHRLKQDQAETHLALSDYFDATGDHASALTHHRRFHQLEREVLSENTSTKLRAVQIRHQVQAAEREAEIHRLRNVELAQAYAELTKLNASLREANEQKSRLLAQLERQTYEDALTGLANRRYLDLRLDEEFQRARRHHRPLALAIADLDHFKRVNDTWSHAVGDDVLRALARILREQIRHTDLVARFGGEEFVLVLTETDRDAALAACEKLRAAVEHFDWNAIHPGLAVTISIGVAAETEFKSLRKPAGGGRRAPVRGQVGRAQLRARLRKHGVAAGRVARCVHRTAPGAAGRGLELAHQPDHDAEDLERALGPDHRVRLVLRLEDEHALVDVQPLQRELVVDDRDDDVAAPRRGALLDDDEVAIEDARVHHRVALDANEHRRRRMLDQVVVDRQRVAAGVVDRVRHAGANRHRGERPLEEAPGRREPLVRRAVDQARQPQPRDQRRHRRLGFQSEQLADRRVRGQRAMARVVILQRGEVGTIVRHGVTIANERSGVKPPRG